MYLTGDFANKVHFSQGLYFYDIVLTRIGSPVSNFVLQLFQPLAFDLLPFR